MTEIPPFLNEDQVAFLEAADRTKHLDKFCDHVSCHDKFHMNAIAVATSVEEYGVTGAQFAAIVMDLTSVVTKLIHQHPQESAAIGLTSMAGHMVNAAAMAWSYHKNNVNAPDVPND